MQIKPRVIFSAFIITVLYFLAFYWCYQFFDDTKDIGYRTALMRGDFTYGPIHSLFIYFIGVSHILSALLSYFPNIPWLGLLLLLLQAFAIFCCGIVLLTGFSVAGINRLLSLTITALAVFVFFAETTFYCSIACCAMEDAAAACMLWMFLSGPGPDSIVQKTLRALCLMVLAVCMLLVNEVVLLGLVPVFLFAIVTGWQRLPALGLGAIVAVMYTLLYVGIYLANDDYKKDFLKHEAYIFNYHDAGYKMPLINPTQQDLIKLKALDKWFVWDKAIIGPAFYKKVTVSNYLVVLNRVPVKQKIARYLAGLNYALWGRFLPVTLCSIFISLLALWGARYNKRLAVLFIVYKVLLVGYFSLMSIFLKFEFRTFYAVFLIDGMLTLMLAFKFWPRQKTAVLMAYVPLLFLLLPSAFLRNAYLNRCSIDLNRELVLSSDFRNETDSLFNGCTIMPDIDACLQLTANPVLVTAPLLNHNTIFGYDCGYSTFYPEFDARLKSMCGSDNFKDAMLYLHRQGDKAVFIATEERIALWEEYLYTLYHVRVKFYCAAPSKVFDALAKYGNYKRFGYYKLRSVDVGPL